MSLSFVVFMCPGESSFDVFVICGGNNTKKKVGDPMNVHILASEAVLKIGTFNGPSHFVTIKNSKALIKMRQLA